MNRETPITQRASASTGPRQSEGTAAQNPSTFSSGPFDTEGRQPSALTSLGNGRRAGSGGERRDTAPSVGGQSERRSVKDADAGLSPAFSYRTEPCDECDRATDIKCDTCWNSGEVDAACAECARVVPINDDGLCLYCADMNELSTVQLHAKWLCAGVLRNPETRVEL